MDSIGWRALDHTADEGLELWAPTYEELLSVGARALFQLMGSPPPELESAPVELVVSGLDREDLLVRLLHEFVVRFTLEGLFLETASPAEVAELADGEFQARLRGTAWRVDRSSESDLVEIKSVTYHGLSVRDLGGHWEARVILDL